MINTDDKSRKESEISSLYAIKRHHEEKIQELERKVKHYSQPLEVHRDKLRKVLIRIKSITDRPILITTHALMQYRDRFFPERGEDDMRNHLVTNRLINSVKVLGNGEYLSDDNEIRIICEDNKIVTVYKSNSSKEELKEHKKKIRKKYGTR